MNNINTQIIENLKLYNGVASNTEKSALTVFDNLPCAIEWSYNGKHHKIENENKLIPLILSDNKHIAIIEAPYHKEFNKAYIVGGNGVIIRNLTTLSKERFALNHIFFSDVYYIKNSLYFFVAISNIDYRFEFNIYTGEVGNLTESR